MSAEDDAIAEDVRQLFSTMQSRIIGVVESSLPILTKDTRDALAIKITNEVRNYLSEVFYT